MIAGLGRSSGQAFHRVVVLLSQTRSVDIDQRLELSTVAEMHILEKSPLVDLRRSLPVLGGDCFLEEPYIYTDELLVESEILGGGKDDIVAEAVSDRVDGLIEGVTRPLAVAFRPEERLHSMS